MDADKTREKMIYSGLMLDDNQKLSESVIKLFLWIIEGIIRKWDE